MKEFARFGGDVSGLVPATVLDKLTGRITEALLLLQVPRDCTAKSGMPRPAGKLCGHLATTLVCHAANFDPTAMPHSSIKHQGLDSRNPLVFDTRDLGPGSARTLTRTIAAPSHMGVELARVPAGADLELDVQLEGVTRACG